MVRKKISKNTQMDSISIYLRIFLSVNNFFTYFLLIIIEKFK
jgi:hypothetical protein